MFGNFRKRVGRNGSGELPFIDENLVDIGGDLSVTSLLRGYRSGAFPWTVNPVTWWSPDPRAILEFDKFHAPRSLLKLLRKKPFTVTMDQAFDAVITECAARAPNRKSTWITPEFMSAYKEMHRAGYAHSLEIRAGGELVGGIYGVALGGYFAGESMFHRVNDASKAALYYLIQHLKARGYRFLDIQMPTQITLQFGASLVPRRVFLKRLDEARALPVTFSDGPGELSGIEKKSGSKGL